MWTGVKPNLSNLKLFGSKVMVHIPKNKRKKFDKESEEMILVAYSETVKGYRVFNPKNSSVITSRDAIVIGNVKNKKEALITLDYEERDVTSMNEENATKNPVLSTQK